MWKKFIQIVTRKYMALVAEANCDPDTNSQLSVWFMAIHFLNDDARMFLCTTAPWYPPHIAESNLLLCSIPGALMDLAGSGAIWKLRRRTTTRVCIALNVSVCTWAATTADRDVLRPAKKLYDPLNKPKKITPLDHNRIRNNNIPKTWQMQHVDQQIYFHYTPTPVRCVLFKISAFAFDSLSTSVAGKRLWVGRHMHTDSATNPILWTVNSQSWTKQPNGVWGDSGSGSDNSYTSSCIINCGSTCNSSGGVTHPALGWLASSRLILI